MIRQTDHAMPQTHRVVSAAVMMAACLAALCGCIPNDGPAMRPGDDCLSCHSSSPSTTTGGRGGHHASPAWSVAGTVFQANDLASGYEGAEVQITDANGWSFSLRTNEAGNFYSAESPTFPLHVCINANGTVSCQQGPVTSGQGGCNSCHSANGAWGAPLSVH
jgi:hypothetical protein